MLIALVLVLAILWVLGYLQIGNLEFLRVPVLSVGERTVTLLDILVALTVILVITALPGFLAVAAGVLLTLWLLAVFGLIAIEGIPLSTLIILVIIVGLLVHLLGRRRSPI
jgi:hypothetical protein